LYKHGKARLVLGVNTICVRLRHR